VNAFTAGYLARLELWGVLVALVQGALVLASWRAWQRVAVSAQARHRLACAHFAALGLLPAITLAISHATIGDVATQQPHGVPVAALPSIMDGVCNALGLALAIVWGCGAVAMLVRLALDARALARVRHAPAFAELVATVRRLAGVSQAFAAPRIREADVSSPQIAGWRRPLLLVPHGLGRRLGPAELDAVLLHELAHVRRSDFRWNLLQRIALALLWFHPVAWALHAGVARERERCCDALAVRQGASPAALARALVKLAEARTRPGPALVMAIADRGGLVERVRCLLEPADGGALPWRRRATALGWSLACLAALGAGRAAAADPTLGDFYTASVFGPTITIQAHDAAGSFALQVRQGRVLQASVREQPVRIVQEGDRVTLTNAERAPVLVLTITPQNRVQWAPRS
jgi:beta-lactamase regulating signal transducer with metallopeptidase domain